jgi:hypothetical protein
MDPSSRYGKPSKLYFDVTRDGKLVYHPGIFLG